MRFDRNGAPREIEGSQSAFIDVIFQLVLFFVFSLAFLAEERQLHAWLPKDGDDGEGATFSPRDLSLWLSWRDGETSCWTPTWFPADGGPPVGDYTFPQDPGLRIVAGADGAPRKVTVTTLRDRAGRPYRVEHDHGVPDMARVEAHLAAAKRRLEALGGRGPSLTVHFDPRVPWQDLVSVVDACLRVGIEDFALGPPEAAP